MEKSIYTAEYEALVLLLKKAREEAGLSQTELADQLGQTQSFVSKVERGERRLDVIQLRTMLKALGVDLLSFIRQLESELTGKN